MLEEMNEQHGNVSNHQEARLKVLSAKTTTKKKTTTTTSDISSRALIKPIARPVIVYLRIYDIWCIYEINSVFTKLQYIKWNNL